MDNKKTTFKDTLKNFKKSWKYIKNQKFYLIMCLIFSMMLTVIGVIVPLFSAKILINITGSNFEELIIVAVVVLFIELTRNLSRYFYNVIFNKYLMEIVLELQTSVASETLNLEVEELDKKSSGVFIDRLNNDTRQIAYIFTEFGGAVIDLIASVGILLAIFITSKPMFIYFVITCTILFFIEKARMKRYFVMDKKIRKLNEKNTGLIGELVRGIRDIKVLNAGIPFLDITRKKLIESKLETCKMEKTNYTYNFFIGNIRDIFAFLFIILGIYLVKNNLLTIASFVIIYMYQDRVHGMLRYFTYVIELTKKFNVSASRIFEIIDDNVFKKEMFGNIDLKSIKGDFEFKNVTFGYNEETTILKNISFKVESNQTVSFVGKSGGGKSTIFSLLNKLYTIKDGEILIDGININNLTKNSIRNNMSIITQTPYIFNFSIKENLKMVKLDVTDEEIIEACKIACLHDYIETLPDKYDTVVGEGGLTLSGGQRQRLAIARALIKKTEIILFDEATSALDNETQKEIGQAIHNMKGDYTILIIAHRLSTVIDSDKIIIVEDGQVIGSGTHKELMEKNSEYKNLYNTEIEK